MDSHITLSNQILQDIEYKKSATIVPLEVEAINLQFMLSLRGSRETFSLAKGDWIRRVPIDELHSEIRVMNARKAKSTTQSVQADTAKAFSSGFGSEFVENGKHRYFNEYGGDDND